MEITALLFNPSSTPIICSSKYERFGFGRQHILVPLLAWRILAPGKNTRSVNLFQKTILKLFRSGVVHSDEIAHYMALDPELIKFIIVTQLQPNGLLDSNFKLTDKAEKVLDDGILGGNELSTGYIYQEPWTGKLLPRISESLDIIEPDTFDAKGFPRFLRSRGEGKYETPLCLNVSSLPNTPSTEEIFEALELAETAKFNSLQMSGDWTESRLYFSKGYDLVEDHPVKVLAWCSVQRSDNGEVPWLASDPLGYFPAADYMRELLDQRIEQDHKLAGKIARLFNIESGDSDDLRVSFEQAEEQLRLELLADWPWLSKKPELEKYLGSLLRLSKANISSGNQCRWEDIENECITAQKVAECLLKIILRKYSGKEVCRSLRSERQNLTRSFLRTLYEHLPVVGLKNEEPNILSVIDSRQLLNAMEKGTGSLRALLAGALLSSFNHPTHPLIELDYHSQGWINKLWQLAELRNKAGHASGDQLDKQQVFNQTQWLISWVKLFEKEI